MMPPFLTRAWQIVGWGEWEAGTMSDRGLPWCPTPREVSRLPQATFEVDHPPRRPGGLSPARRAENHPLGLEQLPLPSRATERESGSQGTVPEYHPVTGDDTWLGIVMEGESDESRMVRMPRQSRHLPISRDLAGRNPSDHPIDLAEERLLFHTSIVRFQSDRSAGRAEISNRSRLQGRTGRQGPPRRQGTGRTARGKTGGAESKGCENIWDMSPEQVKCHYDAVVVGAGAAGLSAALSLVKTLGTEHSKGSEGGILVISKLQALRSHTGSAEGGIAASLGNEEEDDWRWHYYDTVKGGDWLVDQDAARILASQGPQTVIELEHDGVAFSRGKDGHIAQRRFGGHTARFGGKPVKRAAYAADRIGHQILYALWQQCVRYGVEFAEEWYVTDLVLSDAEEGGIEGLVVLDTHDGRAHAIAADNVILCTGGAGHLFHTTSNSWDLTGDGMALALRAGLQLEDIEFIQFHPTGLGHTGILLSEAARGEGGILRNSEGEAFMARYAPEHRDLAPRDVVSRSIASEVDAGRGVADPKEPDGPRDCVWLDMTGVGEERMKTLLPQVYETIVRYSGLDPAHDLVPVKPTAHYTMGGIPATTEGQVYRWANGGRMAVHGLYAAGECSCVGVHGANRLGGNSLLDACLFGSRAGQAVAKRIDGGGVRGQEVHDGLLEETLAGRESCIHDLLHGLPDHEGVQEAAEEAGSDAVARTEEHEHSQGGPVSGLRTRDEADHPADGEQAEGGQTDANAYDLMARVGHVMEDGVAVRCDRSSIEQALGRIDELDRESRTLACHGDEPAFNQELTAIIEVENLLTLARAVLTSSLEREESRGSLYRKDHPRRDDSRFLAHSMVDAQGDVRWQPVHIVDLPPQGRGY